MNENEIQVLNSLGINNTSYATRPIAANARIGQMLGQGQCKAIRLQLPRYNPHLVTDQAVLVVWYGNAKQQTRELLRNSNNNPSDLIICNDLSEVYILALTAVVIEVIIYDNVPLED